jgi:hypothetical protein
MSHESKAFLVWVTAMTLFVIVALAATTLYPMVNAVPQSAGVSGDSAPPIPTSKEVGRWHLVQ